MYFGHFGRWWGNTFKFQGLTAQEEGFSNNFFMPSRPSRTFLVEYRACSCRDLLSSSCTRSCSPYLQKIPLTSHAEKFWDQEKDEVSLLQKIFVTKYYCNRFRSPEGLLLPVSLYLCGECGSMLKESKEKTVSTTSPHFQIDEPEMYPECFYNTKLSA